MCYLCQARDPSVTDYDFHGATGPLESNGSGNGSVSTSLPSYSLDQVSDQLVNGYWNSTGRNWRKFDVEAGDTLTYNISSLDAQGQATAVQAFEAWSAVSGLNFQAVTSTSADLMFMDTNSGAYAYSYLYGNEITRSYINVDDGWQAYGSYYLQTYIHEIGHALGLGHAGNYNGSADFPNDAHYQQDSWQYSIMSYFGQWENSYTDATGNYLATTMMGDIAAIQALYGTPTNANSGDTVYGDNTNLTQVGMDISRSYAITIYDSSGTDTIDLGSRSYSQRLDMRGETFSDLNGETKNFAIARGAVIENVITGSGNDTITGNAADNHIQTGSGNDTIYGSHGDDTVVGGSGTDLFSLGKTYDEVTFGSDGQLTISHSGGTTQLNGIERVWFSDNGYADVLDRGATAEIDVYHAGGVLDCTVDVDIADAHDWSTIAETFSGGTLAERKTLRDDGQTVSDTFDNGTLTSTMTEDTAGIEGWSSFTRVYNTLGQLIAHNVVQDSGLMTSTAFANGLKTQLIATDASNLHRWSSYVDSFNTSGERTSQVLNWDDGRVQTTAFTNGVRSSAVVTDAQNDYSWSTITDTFDPSGARVSQILVQDSGLRIETGFTNGQRSSTTVTDVNDAYGWSSYVDLYDANGARVSQNMLRDDGVGIFSEFTNGRRSATTLTDNNDDFSWSTVTNRYDSQGGFVGQDLTHDDGRLIETTFENGRRTTTRVTDQDDDYSWSTYTDTFDFNGARISQAMTRDDGLLIETDFTNGRRDTVTVTDVTDAYHWASYVDSFDASGARMSRVMTYDNGDEVTTTFFEPVTVPEDIA